ncbi:hypothetical protein [Saccharothrix hoggarensis]|uniref:Uncharacterized protein n=1 Tax=Saccharothrix hoggarensis TaxID=913853 RepID=A0ABW3QXB5_9PSEU
MSGDFSERDDRGGRDDSGLAGWFDAWLNDRVDGRPHSQAAGQARDRADRQVDGGADDWSARREVPGQRGGGGEPAYPASFGWTPPSITRPTSQPWQAPATPPGSLPPHSAAQSGSPALPGGSLPAISSEAVPRAEAVSGAGAVSEAVSGAGVVFGAAVSSVLIPLPRRAGDDLI